jgi:menaquinone-specific isochorismate synthase
VRLDDAGLEQLGIDAGADALLALLPQDEALAWIRHGDGLVAWGIVAQWEFSGQERFSRAQRWWSRWLSEVEIHDPLGLPGTGPVAFASFTFDPDSFAPDSFAADSFAPDSFAADSFAADSFAAGARDCDPADPDSSSSEPLPRAGSTVVVPRVIVGRRRGIAWLTVIDDADAPPAAAEHGHRPLSGISVSGITEPGNDVDTKLRMVREHLDAPAAARQAASDPLATPPRHGAVTYADGALSAEKWMATVAEIIDRISAGEVDKVVLARDVIAHVERPIDVRQLLHRLADDYPECWTFSVAGMVGATPELLVRRTGSEVTSRVLAGTVKRRGDESADASLAAALLGSGKDLEEHEYAVRSVARALSAHCADLDVPQRPRVLRLPNVQHLATDVRGQLVDGAPVLALAASLHPTAAVCGTPTERAFALIRDFEGMDRGRYSGPVGWWDARGDGEFGIALRCAEIAPTGTTLRLFAGCGIVAGSEPEAELAESRAKLVPVRDALEAGTDDPPGN